METRLAELRFPNARAHGWIQFEECPVLTLARSNGGLRGSIVGIKVRTCLTFN